nr:hypothetical protein GCM10020093_036490 [Planobispora longispora]
MVAEEEAVCPVEAGTVPGRSVMADAGGGVGGGGEFAAVEVDAGETEAAGTRTGQ